jgi:hypothetical protein
MSMIGFPLLLIPLAIYNIIVFLMPGVSFVDPVLKLPLMSGAEWPLTLSDMLLTLAILMLLSEVIKGARPGAKYLTDHLLSLIVFGGAAAEFVLWPKFGTSTYFLLTMLALVDFLSGVALRARRRTLVTSGPAPAPVSTKGARAPSAVAAETRFVPEPAPSVPAAAAVAESVLLDRQQPKIQRPEIQKPEVRPNDAPPPEIVRAPPPEVVTAPSPAVVSVPSPGVVTARPPEAVHAPSPEPANAPAPEPVDVPSPEPVDVPSPEPVDVPSPEPVNAPSPEVAHAPSPEVASPDLQPESSSPPSPKEPPQ